MYSAIFLLLKFSINSWAAAIYNNTDNNEQNKNVIKDHVLPSTKHEFRTSNKLALNIP